MKTVILSIVLAILSSGCTTAGHLTATTKYTISNEIVQKTHETPVYNISGILEYKF